jgi:tetratricopeptide (TPR) repeat protein
MEARSSQAAEGLASTMTRRRLILRDGLTFLSLTAVALVLAAVTTLLFRTFEDHRERLAERWAERGHEALQQGRSAEAVTALRTSLSYRPDERDNQLDLASALAASGHTTEAEAYFLNLWQARPGDGPINLQLARLERSRGNATAAINYYRAAVFGTWSGDAPVRRRDTRLELAKYLVERGQAQSAVAELLVMAGNNPDAATQMAIGETLELAHDPKDALAAYRKASQSSEEGDTANAKAGELCFAMGDYACAENLLEKVVHAKRWTDEQRVRLTAMQRDADRLQELAFSHDATAAVRSNHLLNDMRIAEARLKSCAAADEDKAAALADVQAQWKTLDTAKNRDALRHDDDVQAQFATLIFASEAAATGACGAPSGDDALLVRLQTHPMTQFGVGAE